MNNTTSHSANNVTFTKFQITYPPVDTATQRDRFKTLWLAMRTLIRTRKTITPGTKPGQWQPFFAIRWWRMNRKETP